MGTTTYQQSRSEDMPELLARFLEHHRRAAFIQISGPVARVLHHRFGYFATQVGIETSIALENWNLTGKKKQVLRTSLNQADKRGVGVFENCDKASCMKLSAEWLRTRRVRNAEMAFLVRPLELDLTAETRRFCAHAGNELLGFVYFDPIYASGRVIGFVPNVSRASLDFRQGIFYTIMIRAMERFREEGVEFVNLGLSPLALGEGQAPYESPGFKHCLRWLYKRGGRLYNFQGIRFTKSRFQGEERPVFFAHRARLPIREAAAVFRLSNLV